MLKIIILGMSSPSNAVNFALRIDNILQNKAIVKQSVRLQWEKACCGQFKLTKDWKRLRQYSKYMKQSGVDVRGTLWLR